MPPDLANERALVQPTGARSQGAIEPLPPAVAMRLQRAIDLRASGLPERSRDTLLAMLRELPHHPQVVTELGRTHLARQDWLAVERLAVSERLARRDSVLLGRELAEAQERLGRGRDAQRTALEAWTVSPADGAWASAAVLRLAPLDPKGTATALEAVATARPWRTDLVMTLARLHAVSGRPDEVVRVLAAAEKRSNRNGLRVLFADETLRMGTRADTTAALAVLTDLTTDRTRRPEERLATARRAWVAAVSSGRDAEWAPKLAEGLREVPAERWGPELLLSVVRTLQKSGHTAEARALLAANPALERRMPELSLERALGLARDGQLATALPLLDSLTRVLPNARFMLAEVQFFAGALDSAQVNYDRVSALPSDPDAAAALDRLYLLEEAPRSPARYLLGQIAYERWRSRRSAATQLADSLWRTQAPHGDYAARAGLELASLRMEAGDARGALSPLLVVCDSLADDRLAPLARQRAGDAYLALNDDKSALAQYEECLARYPRAWNSPEVRRAVERLRKERL
ncbi:MAG: hypothetical protein ABL977_04425 [Candidatus Eisenbacteria bacterium]